MITRRNTVSAVAVWTVEYGKYTSAPKGSASLSCSVLIRYGGKWYAPVGQSAFALSCLGAKNFSKILKKGIDFPFRIWYNVCKQKTLLKKE